MSTGNIQEIEIERTAMYVNWKYTHIRDSKIICQLEIYTKIDSNGS